MADVGAYAFFGAGPGRIPTLDDVDDTLAAIEEADRTLAVPYSRREYAERREQERKRDYLHELRLKAARERAEQSVWREYQREYESHCRATQRTPAQVVYVPTEAPSVPSEKVRLAIMRKAAVDAQAERYRLEAKARERQRSING